MLKRDYLQKQIEEFARVLEKLLSDILKLRNEGKVNEAYILAKESLTSKFELDMDNILALSADDFQKVILDTNTSNPVQLNYLAELMCTTAELLKEKNEYMQMKDLFRKSLMIYQHLDKTQRTYSAERQEKIKQLKKHLDE